MVGRDGVFTPLLKMVIESAMEGELDAHLQETRATERNRRNGKRSKEDLPGN
jgi:putative transposase